MRKFFFLTISVVHDDAQLSGLSLVRFFKTNDIWMIDHFEEFGFPISCFLFLFAHLFDVYLFDHCVGLI